MDDQNDIYERVTKSRTRRWRHGLNGAMYKTTYFPMQFVLFST